MSTQKSRPTDASLRQYIGYGIKRAFNAVQADLNAALAPFDLRLITFSTLSLIDENSGLNQSQLAELLSIDRPNLVSIADELEKRGLILRTRDKDDRRSNALTLTQAGRALLSDARQAVTQHEARMTTALADSDRHRLFALLAAIEAAPSETGK